MTRRWTAIPLAVALAVASLVALPSAAHAEAGIGPWVAQSAPASSFWASVTYGDGLFGAVSEFGDDQVMTSPDGMTWTTRSTPEADVSWTSVTYGGGRFVAVGAACSCSASAMWSADGVTWTASSTQPDDEPWASVTYGNGRFVAVAPTGKTAISTDGGASWTTQLLGPTVEDGTWTSVTYGGG